MSVALPRFVGSLAPKAAPSRFSVVPERQRQGTGYSPWSPRSPLGSMTSKRERKSESNCMSIIHEMTAAYKHRFNAEPQCFDVFFAVALQLYGVYE